MNDITHTYRDFKYVDIPALRFIGEMCIRDRNKGIVHCGECPDIPCELLMQYSCDPEHGDTPQGARIEQSKRWYAESKGKN